MPEVALDSAQTDHAPEHTEGQELGSMSFLDHLEELRRRLIYALISVTAGVLVSWPLADRIFAVMQQPIMQALRRHQLDDKLVYLSPTEPFNIYLKVALIAGLFVSSPLVLYQLWAFVAPGLYRNEKRYVLPFMFSTVALFLSGGYFGYRLVYPAALDFLIGYGEQFRPMITIGEYTDLFLTVILGLGVVFELPVVIFFLALMGVVDAAFLWNNLRYAVLSIFIIAAILTPTTDIVNLMIFAAPMIALYMLSIGIAWFVHPRRRRARAAAS
ncbi:MAG: twin-arginine translocase subunit TatC [Acidobacteria bacterium]|nr:twin-arginine translocase subunit TatC [Acidobacteriota bacterium]